MTLICEELVVEYSAGGYIVRPIDGLEIEVPNGELALLLGIAAFAFWFAPPERGGAWFMALFGDGLLESTLAFSAYAFAVCIAEPFFVGAGFAMYLNRRVELEAWDIEQEFRRAFGS